MLSHFTNHSRVLSTEAVPFYLDDGITVTLMKADTATFLVNAVAAAVFVHLIAES